MKMPLRSRKKIAGLIVAGAAMLLLAFFGNKQTPNGPVVRPTSGYRVTSVIDGDTIEVDDAGKIEKVRLLGIDTPELHDPRKPVQCFAAEASKKSQQLMDNQVVQLESDPSQGDRDKYGRLLRYVYLPDGRQINQLLVEEGYAHEYTYQSQPYKYQQQYKTAQTEARESSRGFWAADTCGGDTKQSVTPQ